MFRSWTKKKLFFFFGACLAACTPNFSAASDVSDLRVLAVQAEPPEALYDAEGATVTNVPDVQVRVLAVDPARQAFASITMKATLCAPTDSRRCEGDPRLQLPLPQETRKGGAEFSETVPGALMAQVIQFARDSAKLGDLNGIRVMFALSVDDSGPFGPQSASKMLIYNKSGGTPNHNPLMIGLDLTQDGIPTGTVAASAPLRLPLNVEVGIRPLLAADAREEYDTTDLSGNTVHLKEQPRYSFFTTGGAELDRDTADEPVDGVAPPDGLVRIRRFADPPGTLWVVVRDGRGGESWLAFDWTAP